MSVVQGTGNMIVCGTHKHTHTHALSLSLSHTHRYTHTHTHTHTPHTYTHSHTHTLSLSHTHTRTFFVVVCPHHCSDCECFSCRSEWFDPDDAVVIVSGGPDPDPGFSP